MSKDKWVEAAGKGLTEDRRKVKTASSQSLVDEVRRRPETLETVLLASDDNMAGKNPFEALLGCERASSRILPQPPEINLMPVSEFKIPNNARICADYDFTMHVSRDNVQKIWVGDYINLAGLLKKGTETTPSPICIDEISGTIEVKPKPARVVQNIREWTNAFLIFSDILIKKNPEKAVELLQYMALIREAEARAQGSFAWRQYDENFRMRQAVQPQSWAKINSDLWLRAMTFPALSQPLTTSFNRYSSNKPRLRPCFDFNSPRGCSFKPCKYDHLCTACRGRHSLTKCPRSFDQNFRSLQGNFSAQQYRQVRK